MGEAEVEQDGLAVGDKPDVVRFDVAVNKPFAVQASKKPDRDN